MRTMGQEFLGANSSTTSIRSPMLKFQHGLFHFWHCCIIVKYFTILSPTISKTSLLSIELVSSFFFSNRQVFFLKQTRWLDFELYDVIEC